MMTLKLDMSKVYDKLNGSLQARDGSHGLQN